MDTPIFLGVDGGGTQTRALAARGDGTVLGVQCAGSSNRNHHTRAQVRENLRAALLGALGTAPAGSAPAGIFLGMCGVSTDADRDDIISIVREIPELPPGVPMRVENDTRIGLTGGLSGRPGMVLIAGTGSACFGMNGAGGTCLCGGWGALADDAGSAPWIGLRAIGAAVRAEDGRRGPTALRGIVFDFLGLREPRQLIDRVHNQGLEREEIGRLAPLVIEACRQGDAAALAILDEAVAELSLMVAAAARGLFGARPFEVILVGGLALSGPPFQTRLIERIQRDTPAARVREAEMPPVHGAVLEALRAAGAPWTDTVLANLRAFQG